MDFKLEEANRLWNEIRAKAHDYLGQARPNARQDLRNEFLAAQFKGNFGKLKSFRKTMYTKTKTQAVQAIGDMFTTWCSDGRRLQNVDKAKAEGKNISKDELAWSETRRAKDRRPKTGGVNPTTCGHGGAGSSGGGGTTSTSSTTATTTTARWRDAPKTSPQPFWRLYELADGFPLYDEKGEIAPKLNLEDPYDTARGYHFCTSEAAIRLCARYMKRDNAVTFLIPPHGGGFKDEGRDMMDKLNADSDGKAKVSIVNASIYVKDAEAGRKTLDVHLVHADARKPILPVHMIDDGMVMRTNHAELKMDLPHEDELQVSVLEPICRELGLEAWWKKFQARPFPHFKDDIKVLLESAEYKPKDIRVRRDRSMNWKGEQLEDARVVAYFKVPAHLTDQYLAKSGRKGLIIDRAGRAGPDAPQLAKIRLPSEWTMADALAKVDKLPMEIRKRTCGIVPTPKGYILRACKDAEAELTRNLNPDRAAELGNSLGLNPNSMWRISNIPRAASKADIIRTFAASGPTWAGWKLIPTRTIGQPMRGRTSWIVEAEVEPPAREAYIQGVPVTIDRHLEQKKVSSRAAPWMKLKAEDADEVIKLETKSLWADVVDDDDPTDAAQEMTRPQRQSPAAAAVAGATAAAAADTSMLQRQLPVQHEGDHQSQHQRNGGRQRSSDDGDAGMPPNKGARMSDETMRPLQTEPASRPQCANVNNADIAAILADMQVQMRKQAEEAAKKDEMITQLQRTIESLQATIGNLQAALQAEQQLNQQQVAPMQT